MRIGFIEDTHLHGGTQIWVTEAIRAFLERGLEVTLIAPQGSWMVKQNQQTGAHIATYDWDGVVKESAHDQEIWTEALRDCDVVICTVHPPREGFHCSVFAGRCIKEGILKTHLIPKTGTIVPEYLREFYLPDETINSSVIAIADFTRQYLVDSYKIPEEKVKLLYQGTDVERFKSEKSAKIEAQKRYRLPEDAAPILGSIGSIEPRKGHIVLFGALKELVEGDFPKAHLIIVGDGPDEDLLKQKAKEMGLEQQITFFPFTDEPNYIFERIDITVLPSLYKEGLPNVLLESVAMGVPVVSSNLGGVPELVIEGETGYLVEPGDQDELAGAIKKLWSDQEMYQKMKMNARNLVVNNFNKAIQFDRFKDYFFKLIHPA
ncbi:MAG: glycosyltransferase family 4 protein [Chloroflexota bacterium]